LFDDYSERELESISEEFVHEHYHRGEIILAEGAIGDRLHVLLSGSVRVYTHSDEREEIVLARLERGAYFGEQALLTSHQLRRNASVRALSDVETASLTHEAFQKYLKANERLRHLLAEVGQRELLLKLSSHLRSQGNEQREIGPLLDRIRSLTEREVIFRQGDDPDNAYFLLTGRVELRFYGEDRRLTSHTFIEPGQLFGELGVLERTPRLAMAVAAVDSQVAVIDSPTFAELYRDNPQVQALVASLRALYQVAALGLVTQYQGEFLGRPASQTTIRKPNGELVTVSRLLHENVVGIGYASVSSTQEHEHFEDAEDHSRDLIVENGRLVGAVSLGTWDDLPELFRAIYERAELSDSDLASFRQSGGLALGLGSSVSVGFLCECLRIGKDVLEGLMAKGTKTVEALSGKTGAGTVCGGCRPRIVELTGGAAWTYVTVAGIREHTETVRSYRLEPVSGRVQPLRAGQHVVVEGKVDGRWVARSYTLTDADRTRNFYEITVKREALGYFSDWLFAHDREPLELRVSEPQGAFVVESDLDNPVCCLMAGIGITPAIAFGRQLADRGDGRPLHIDYSVHAREETAFQRELTSWPQELPNVSVHTRVTSAEGRLGEAAIRTLLDRFPDADFYICGPEPYLAEISTRLTDLGVPRARVHLEEFVHAGDPRVEAPSSPR
jgi:ferredoxin-NADP reductase/CRP-like cAMP-binding protein